MKKVAFILLVLLGAGTNLSAFNGDFTTADTDSTIILNQLGFSNFRKGNFREAKKFFQRVLELNPEVENAKDRAFAYRNMANIYIHEGRRDLALDYRLEAFKLYELLNDEDGIAISFVNIGSIHSMNGDPGKGLEYYKKGIEMHEKARNLAELGSTLFVKGLTHRKIGEMEEALDAFNRSLAIQVNSNDQDGVGNNLMGIGGVYINQGRLEEALPKYKDALRIFRSTGNKLLICHALQGLAKLYNVSGQPEKSLGVLEECLEIASNQNFYNIEVDCNFRLSQLYKAKGDFEKALDYYEKSMSTRDSLKSFAMWKIPSKFEDILEASDPVSELKDDDLENFSRSETHMQRQRSGSFSGALFFAVLLLFGISAFLWSRSKRSGTDGTRDLSISTNDQRFLEQIDQHISDNIEMPEFGVSELAQAMGISRSGLQSKLKKLGRPPASAYIRSYRLEKAMDLLKTTNYNVSEVAYMTGFKAQTYFSTCFKEKFGFSPSSVKSTS